MKRRAFIQSFAAGAVTLIGFEPQIDLGAETAGTLETAFRQPPPGAHAKTWWHWMNGNITAEGITLDLEAMKREAAGEVSGAGSDVSDRFSGFEIERHHDRVGFLPCIPRRILQHLRVFIG